MASMRVGEIPKAEPAGRSRATTSLLLEGVSKRWGRQGPVALAGCQLRVGAGECVWIGGRNGVGKTTLLRIAAGLFHADAGTVSAFGLDPVRDRRAYQSRVSLLSAGNTGVYARLTPRQHLELQGRLALLAPSARSAASERALGRFEIGEFADRRMDRLSLGQRQRLRLALALLADPGMVLLDEPATSLDAEGRTILGAALRDVSERGGAVLWCSPDLQPDEMAWPHRKLLLDRGQLVST